MVAQPNYQAFPALNMHVPTVGADSTVIIIDNALYLNENTWTSVSNLIYTTHK